MRHYRRYTYRAHDLLTRSGDRIVHLGVLLTRSDNNIVHLGMSRSSSDMKDNTLEGDNTVINA